MENRGLDSCKATKLRHKPGFTTLAVFLHHPTINIMRYVTSLPLSKCFATKQADSDVTIAVGDMRMIEEVAQAAGQGADAHPIKRANNNKAAGKK